MKESYITLQRRSIRFQSFDYSQPGIYFVTICAFEMKCMFGSFVSQEMRLSRIGEIVEECWSQIPGHFRNVGSEMHVVMPNHLHGLLTIRPDGKGARHAVPLQSEAAGDREGYGAQLPREGEAFESFQRPVAGSLGTIVRSFKAAVTARARQTLKRSELVVWQRNYYERVIRTQKEIRGAQRYVFENPARWLAKGSAGNRFD